MTERGQFFDPDTRLSEVPKWLSKRDREMAKRFGGSEEEDWREYEKRDNLPSPDKGSHRERSLYNQPNHKEHWRKEKKKP